MAARRVQQAKQSLATGSNLSTLQASSSSKTRLKSTSMTNLVSGASPSSSHSANQPGRIQRPASRNALDNIHKGMNAKFTHVQSKVLLQNIRPQQQQHSSKIPAKPPLERLTPSTPSSTLRRSNQPPTAGKAQLSDRSQLLAKIKTLQEEVERHERQREELKQELERERADKAEQVQQIKLELQERVAESERQNEEYHQKLLEAYELADQNRRAADSVLSESRQREEELRKKIDELEQQLGELREFVAMKEEMTGKMSEMRDQIRAERERYEEKTRSLHQMFENEKLSQASHSRLDQNSNYFRRAKPTLQSAESINRLDDDVSQLPNGRHHHQSEHDIYGSKLSTRMQDGARIAWKKSRKFASSVISGSLGGLSACRRSHLSGGASSKRQEAGRASAAADDQHHTSVIEVGSTVGEFAAQGHQPAETSATIHHHHHHHHPQQQPLQQQQQVTVFGESRGNQDAGLIRVDENNKLTIVTKFSEQASQQSSPEALDQPAASSSPSSERSCSERSRCESSSSGRGTASDEANSCQNSHNGDHSDQPLDQQRDEGAKAAPAGDDQAAQQKQQVAPAHQRHKRKSSLFKASAFSGSQASLNKTFKSFFALASSKAGGGRPDEMSAGTITTIQSDYAPVANHSSEVFVEGRHPNGRAASTPTSSLKSSSLTDSERTITGDASGAETSLAPTNSTTKRILDEFVRYEEAASEPNNNELRAAHDKRADANELEGKSGQGDSDNESDHHRRRSLDGEQATLARFEHHHRPAVAVEP